MSDENYFCDSGGGQTAARRVFVHSGRKLPRKPGKKFFLGKAGLLLQRGQDIRADRLLQLRRRNLLVGTVIDPGLGRVALTVLLELFEQLADAAIEQPAYAHAAQ